MLLGVALGLIHLARLVHLLACSLLGSVGCDGVIETTRGEYVISQFVEVIQSFRVHPGGRNSTRRIKFKSEKMLKGFLIGLGSLDFQLLDEQVRPVLLAYIILLYPA